MAPPKVVIVGGGPVGLVLAHALSRADIDFVVLESRPSIVMAAGASLVLMPIGLRALSQFGMLDAIESVSAPLSICKRFDHEGRGIGDVRLFERLRENHGVASRVITRRNFMQVLLDTLPAEAQAKLLPGKKVSGLVETADGVVVSCADGTEYAGTLVVGADGAYSAVRRLMATMDATSTSQHPEDSQSEEKETEKEKEKTQEPPYLTTYRCFWLRFPRLPGISPGDMTESHGPFATTQYFANDDSAVVAVYERLPSPTRHPPRRYSADDEAAFIAKWGHLPLNYNANSTTQNPEGKTILTLSEAYGHAIQTGFINLEEGVVGTWSQGGRAVLVGDAAHKFTPSTGAGCNNGIIDVVVLANSLHKLFSRSGSSSSTAGDGEAKALREAGEVGIEVKEEELAGIFRAYQDARFDVVTLGCGLSGRATHNASWATRLAWFVDVYVMSRDFVLGLFLAWAARKTVLTPVFDFIEGEDKMVGKWPWAHKIPRQKSLRE